MSTPDELIALLTPFIHRMSSLDLGVPATATAQLEAAIPFATLEGVRGSLFAARDAGWLVPRQASPGLRFGRLAKPSDKTLGWSIDVVDMEGAGAEHLHPNGEISLCFQDQGSPLFCGHPPGWVVVPPGSQHIPEVTGGRMLIAYFLPGGAMTWI